MTGAVLVALVGVGAVVAWDWGGGPGRTGVQRAGATQAVVPLLSPLLAAKTRFPGTLPALPLPKQGQAAVLVQGVGLVGATPGERAIPMASVTKVMTAIVVLRDHPLAPGASGPLFTMTAADHAAWVAAVANDESNLEVVAGEQLTERQLLEALMIPSADNIANYLATWDAGSLPKFVAKMNKLAAALGLRHTHYADASGLSPQSLSTAVDQARLAEVATHTPGMVGLVDHATMVFPVTGAVSGYNPLVGQDGVVGLKSGFTSQAQACLVTVAQRTVAGHHLLVITSSLDQPLGLAGAGQVDLHLLDAATGDLQARAVLAPSEQVARVTASWAHGRLVLKLPATVPTVVGWPGLVVHTTFEPSIPIRRGQRGWPAGAKMATVRVWTSGGTQFQVAAGLDAPLPAPPASGT